MAITWSSGAKWIDVSSAKVASTATGGSGATLEAINEIADCQK